MDRPPLRQAVILAAIALTAASGCTARRPASEEAPPRAEAGFPVTVSAVNGDVLIESRPRRIVSMSATATEILFAIGAGDQVVAVDSTSNYPPEAPTTDLSAFEPNAEAVAEFDPDLVVISDDINDILRSLETLEIPVIHQPAAKELNDTYAQIEQLGTATGNGTGAEELVASMRSSVDELVNQAPDFDPAPTYYHELDQTFFSVTSDTFIGQVYSLVGLTNIADAAKGGGSYPQLSAEFIVAADPDLIVLADTKCCGVTAASVARRPGWDRITAVRTGSVLEVDDDIASRWGPRIVDFLRLVVEELSGLRPAA